MREAGAATGFAIEPLGETMLVLRFGECLDAGLNARVHATAATLRAADLPGVIDLVPAYAALGLVYAPAVWASDAEPAWRGLAEAVRAVLATPPPQAALAVTTIEVPVCYGGDYGPDLDRVAGQCRLSADALIACHAAAAYQVAMLGFAPGFPYLLGLHPALHVPRRASPRLRVPRGSVAIGGAQTGIYPDELPGGWQLIGRTPLTLFDAVREPPCLLAPGDRVRFRAIDASEFDALEQGAAR